MEIVVNDTNILIDLYNAGLLEHCKSLGLEFRTLDVIMDEIEDEKQKKGVQDLVDEGTLKVCSLSGLQVSKVYEKIGVYAGKCNLSAQDISVMVYAIDNKCRLLTGDKTLRDKATLENVKVSGILYLTDMLSNESIVSPSEMIVALNKLSASNNRLPKKLIQDRIDALTARLNTHK